MSRYRALIGVIISAAGILVLLGLSQLELYPRHGYVPASREVRANVFYALEKWLASSGHPVRSAYRTFSPDLAGFIRKLGGREGIVFLESSLFSWDEAAEALLPWLWEGGALILSLNPSWDGELEEDLLGFFDSLGILVKDEKNLPDPEADEAEAAAKTDAGTGGTEGAGEDEGAPLFDRRFRFSPTGKSGAGGNPAGEEAAPVFIRDRRGLGRLAEIPLGKGSLTVIGLPLFMYNGNLKEEANARLSWNLTGGKSPAERPEILFVRGGGAVKSLTGRLLERGNILPPLAAALFLILAGFWMLIPSFGIPRRETPDGGPRSIRERFRAEALFLKKHRALGLYLEAYIREIEYRGRLRNRDTADLVEPVKAALGSGKRLSSPEAVRRLESLMEVLRRL
jgi:hypothetical protein